MNSQRVSSWGGLLYEQPTESGLPMAYTSHITFLTSLQVKTVKKLFLKETHLLRKFLGND